MTLFGENYNSAEFMLGLITRAEHCAGPKQHCRKNEKLLSILAINRYRLYLSAKKILT